MSATTARVRTLMVGGGVVFWAVLALLATWGGYALVDAVLLAVILAGLPAFSLAQVPMIRGTTIDRLPAYWSSILTLWLLGAACWLVGTREAGAAGVGIVSIAVLPLVVWSVALTVGGLALILAFRWIGGRVGVAETLLLRSLLPRTPHERRVFGVLSLAAGTSEEIAYRGYSIPALAPLLGLAPAVLVTTLVFGLMHAYQGWLGILRTALMGLVLAGGFVLSGSLLPAMVAHIAIDLIAGIALGDWLLSPEPPYGVEPSVPAPS